VAGGARDEEVDDLRLASKALANKINALSESGSGSDLPIAGYDDMTAVEISNRLRSLSQGDLEKVGDYERGNANRSTGSGASTPCAGRIGGRDPERLTPEFQ
jgi:hypothetical protein